MANANTTVDPTNTEFHASVQEAYNDDPYYALTSVLKRLGSYGMDVRATKEAIQGPHGGAQIIKACEKATNLVSQIRASRGL